MSRENSLNLNGGGGVCFHVADTEQKYLTFIFVLGRGASRRSWCTTLSMPTLLSTESSTSSCAVTSTVRVRTKRYLRRGSRVSGDDGLRPQVYLAAARRAGRGSLAQILSGPSLLSGRAGSQWSGIQ